MNQGAIQQTFQRALDDLVGQVKADRSILAAILCGSLSHDTVWAKSDIDLLLVTVDDKNVSGGDVALYADGVNVHAILVPRAQFRKMVDGSIHHSFTHSLLAKGRLLYTHDPTIEALCARLQDIGDRDAQLQLLRAGTHALMAIYKARKWFVTRGDLHYTTLWILYAVTPLAEIEMIEGGRLVDREVIPQAVALNPAFFNTVYTELLNTKKTPERVRAALDAIEHYLASRAMRLFGLVLEYLSEVGDVRSSSDIEDHFQRHYNLGGVTVACEYLADQGLIAKASTPARLTKKSRVDVQELAFAYFDRAPGR